MRRYIKVNNEVRDRLMRDYNVTRQTIWEALSFITRNDRGNSIRKDALAMGGEYREENFVPNCRTEFHEGGMRQIFAGGIEVVTEGNRMSLIISGEEIEHYDSVDLASWGNVLERAQGISSRRILTNTDR